MQIVLQKEGVMKVITLRNLPPELARIIRRKAQAKGTSLTKVVAGLLEESVGIRSKKRGAAAHHDLDDLAGSWSKEEASVFDKALARQRPIDPDLWR
jgi:hypothetical protein